MARFSLDVRSGNGLAVELSGIEVRGSSKGRIPRIDHERWVETIVGVERWVRFVARIHRAAEVVILQWTIKNSRASAHDRLAVQPRRGVGKADAWRDVFEICVCPLG